MAGAGAGAVALILLGQSPVLRGLTGAVLLAAVVAGAVAFRRLDVVDQPVWWLVAGGVTLTAVSVALGPGHPSGVAPWATALGTAAVVGALAYRVVRRVGQPHWCAVPGMVGFVGAGLTAGGLALQLGGFLGPPPTVAANLVCVVAAGVLAMVVTVQMPTVADRLLLTGATVLVVSQPVGAVSPAWGLASATVGGALAALAPLGLRDGPAAARPDSQPDEPQQHTHSPRARVVMAVAAAGPPVSALVVTLGTGDQRLLVVALGQLVLVVVLVVALLRLDRDRARHVGRATELAETDPVTGLANRQRFQADVAKALAGSRDTVNVTVMLVALESFTELRARLGEATAENLQVAAARRLVLQASDALAVGHLHADVVALVFDVMSADRAGSRAQHLVDVLREPIDLPQLSVSVGAVVGLATGQSGSADAGSLIASAELALTAARGPAGPLVRFTPELERRDAMASQLVGELSEAIARGEVQAYFQPQLDLATGKVTGAEALVRWLHPSLGLLNPAAFVPAAEVTGTIRMITVHVLDQALYWGARWARAGRPINVSVNLSARDLLHARLVDDVREALARYSMPASRLELEITETMAMADVALSQRVLTDLARLGVTISIDDYGTGYGSLAYLQQLPVRRLKIDRSFVSRILDDEASMAIVRSTIELAGELGLDTVAEGVEDEATVQRLRAFGCGSVQGFGVAAPMSPEGFERAIWRLEHRPRPGVAAVRPVATGHEAATVRRAAYPSVAQAYLESRDADHDPGWWTGDQAQVPPGRTDPVPTGGGLVSSPAAGPEAAPQVPQPVQGSPWSAPGGVQAPAPSSAAQPPPVVVHPRAGSPRSTSQPAVAQSAAAQPAVEQPGVQPAVQPSTIPAPRGWVPQRQRTVVPDERSGWPTRPGDRTDRPSTSDTQADWPSAGGRTDWTVALEPDGNRPTRRELRRQRERGAPVTGAGSVTGLRSAAASDRTIGHDPV